MIDCMKCAIDFAFLKVSILHAYGVLLGILCRNTKIKTNTNTNTKKKKTKYGTCHWLHLSQSSSARCFFLFPHFILLSLQIQHNFSIVFCVLWTFNLFFFINFLVFPLGWRSAIRRCDRNSQNFVKNINFSQEEDANIFKFCKN